MQPPAPPGTNYAPHQVVQAAAPQKKKRRTWLIVVAILLALGVIGSISNCIQGVDPSMKSVPDVVGMAPTSAEKAIGNYSSGSSSWNVVFTIEGKPTSSSAKDLERQGYVVISQNPAAGTEHSTSQSLKVTLDLALSPDHIAQEAPELPAETYENTQAQTNSTVDPISDPNNAETKQRIEAAVTAYVSEVYPTFVFSRIYSIDYRSESQQALGGQVIFTNNGLDTDFDFVFYWESDTVICQMNTYDDGIIARIDRATVFFNNTIPDRVKIQ